MSEEELFEYLGKNLYLDYEKGWYSNDVTIKLKLRAPEGGHNKDAELGSVLLEIPKIVGSDLRDW